MIPLALDREAYIAGMSTAAVVLTLGSATAPSPTEVPATAPLTAPVAGSVILSAAIASTEFTPVTGPEGAPDDKEPMRAELVNEADDAEMALAAAEAAEDADATRALAEPTAPDPVLLAEPELAAETTEALVAGLSTETSAMELDEDAPLLIVLLKSTA